MEKKKLLSHHLRGRLTVAVCILRRGCGFCVLDDRSPPTRFLALLKRTTPGIVIGVFSAPCQNPFVV